jgi:hypothetical protein
VRHGPEDPKLMQRDHRRLACGVPARLSVMMVEPPGGSSPQTEEITVAT